MSILKGVDFSVTSIQVPTEIQRTERLYEGEKSTKKEQRANMSPVEEPQLI